jgi:chromatin remodeling complex protein RSC6
MQKLFGVEKFSMFHMAKYVGAHVEPFKPVDLTPKVKDPNKPKKKRKNAKEDKKGKGGKRGKRMKKENGVKRKAPTSFTAPFRLSQDLQDIVGKEIMSRPQVTAALWVYIKANNMQVSFCLDLVFCVLIPISSTICLRVFCNACILRYA